MDKKGWKDIGWYVGYFEKKENVYFFATRISNKVYPQNNSFSKCRTTITLQALNSIMPDVKN